MKNTLFTLLLILTGTVLFVHCKSPKPAVSVAPAPKAVPVAAAKSRGEELYDGKCGRCHRLYPAKAFTQREWDEIMPDMAVKSKLTDEETASISDYLNKNCKNCAQ